MLIEQDNEEQLLEGVALTASISCPVYENINDHQVLEDGNSFSLNNDSTNSLN
jgi:hypothetical protein